MTVARFSRWASRLTERRSRRGWWAHVVWGLCYSLFVLAMLGSFGARGWGHVIRALPLFAPLVLVIVQLVRPTILGWLLVTLPGTAYALVMVVALVLGYATGAVSFHDSGSGAGLAFAVAFVGVVAGLASASWPESLPGAS